MSQSSAYNSGGGGGGTPIETINGNVGSATGSSVSIKVNQASLPAYFSGSTVNFYASGSTDQLSFTDNLDNTGIGYLALSSLAGSGGSNTALGFASLNAVTSGDNNTGVGADSGMVLNTGESNSLFGYASGLAITSGNSNTLIGVASANRLVSGSYNIIVGSSTNAPLPFTTAAGYNYTTNESSNIIIGNQGVTGDSNILRIGMSGSGNGQQNKCFISAINGITVATADQLVVVNGSDQVGAIASGASGQILASQGAGANPHWISNSSIMQIDGDVGSVTGNPITFLGSASGSSVAFNGAVSTMLLEVTDSSGNTIIGNGSGNGTLSGLTNTAIGKDSLVSLTTGDDNIAIGYQALNSTTSGSSNIVIGGGLSNTVDLGDGNIIIGSTTAPTPGISDNIVIGNTTSAKCFIAGIEGVTVSAADELLLIDASGQVSTIPSGTSGQILASQGAGSNPHWINNSSTGFTWNDVTGGSATLAENNGYIADSGSLTTFTLPTNNAFGDTIQVVGKGSGGWTIVYSTSQFINFGSQVTTPTSGSLSSTNANDCLVLVCTSSSLTAPIFTVTNSIGNITVV